MRRRRRVLVLAGLGLLVALVSCSGGDGEPADDPRAVLDQARATLDRAGSVHFVLRSEGVPPGSGTRLLAGEGDAVRPDGFQGSLQVSLAGFPADVQVLSRGGAVYAQLPLTNGLTRTDPQRFGLADPGTLIDPTRGLSRLLSAPTEVRALDQARVEGELVDEFAVTLPGSVVDELLTSADPAAEVTGTVSITTTGRELRRAVLTGPFYERGTPSTFTLTLTEYGADVRLSEPPGS